MSSKSASAFSSADLAALTKAIEVLASAQTTNNKLVASVLERLASGPAPAYGGKPSADSASVGSAKGKRGRPKSEKEPKVKAVPPAAEDGTIRFGSASEGAHKEFSSFFKAPFVVAGKEYLSLANFFHSAKFAGSDDDFAEDIRTQKNPALTRAKASSVKEHAPIADWDAEKTVIMRRGLLAKFSAHSALRAKLLDTGDALLESTIDEEMRVKGFWSIGEDGSGANTMGQLLMSVRAELSSGGGGAPKAKPAAPKVVSKPSAPAPTAKKATPAPKAEEADSGSDSDTDEEDEAPAPKAKKPVSKAPAPAPAPAEDEDSDSDEDEDSDSDEDEDDE